MKPKILLHICCAPCSTQVIKRLKKDYEVCGYFCNPNIFPKEEYQIRFKETQKLAHKLGVEIYCVERYDKKDWLNFVKEFKQEPEGGARCKKCYEYRLRKTASKAKDLDINIFATTLTISPYKKVEVINKIGRKVAREYNLKFLAEDFKKQDGFRKSVELSKKYSLYRQNYCGCEFSKR